MNKFYLLFCFFFTTCPEVGFAQHHSVEWSGGWMNGLFKSNKMNQIPWGKANKFSLGTNQHVQGKYLYFADSSLLNFEMSAQYNWGKSNLAYNNSNAIEQSLIINSNFLQIESGFGINWKIKQLKFRFSQGILLPMLMNSTHQYYLKDSVKTVEYSSQIKNYQSLGYYSQLWMCKQINEKLALRISVDFNFLNVKIKSEKVDKINHSQGLTVNEYYNSTADKEYLFYKDPTLVRNNKDALPQFFKADKPTEFNTYRQSYSGIGFKIGLIFY